MSFFYNFKINNHMTALKRNGSHIGKDSILRDLRGLVLSTFHNTVDI